MSNNGRPKLASARISEQIETLKNNMSLADAFRWLTLLKDAEQAEADKALARAGTKVMIREAVRQALRNKINKVVKVLDKGPKTVTNPGVLAAQERQKRERGE